MTASLSLSRILLAFGLLGCSVISAARGETWEATVSPFAPAPHAETRLLRAQYNFGWSGLTAATADIRLARSGGRYQLDATGGTVGLARALWRYDVNHTALADAATLRPISVKEVETTRWKEKHTEVAFSPAAVTSVSEDRKDGHATTNTRHFEFPNALSVEAALLFVRTLPMPDGAIHRVVVYPATSAYLCTATVRGRERLTVPAGNYNAIKVEIALSKIGPHRELLPHKKFRNATVWVSDDSDCLVLRIEAQVFIGKVFAELRAVQLAPANP